MSEGSMMNPSRPEIVSGVVADWSDDRDAPYSPATTEQPPATFELDRYRALADETFHQRGQECTGFALAAIANFLLRSRPGGQDAPLVSRRMFYEMAQKHDGEMHVEGSTLRGALKGWSRVGVCADELWPYHPNDEDGSVHGSLTLARALDARTRPLLGYRRIMSEDVATMKHALIDGNPLYVAARTHVGWYRLFLNGSDAIIERRRDDRASDIHAFVIIGYDERGFVVHNSWGPEWGDDGYAVLPYDQWQWGATDAWVTSAGIDPAPRIDQSAVDIPPSPAEAKESYRDMWPHLVVLDDYGQLASTGLYEMDRGSVGTVLYLFDEFTKAQGWEERRLAIICDDGAISTAASIDRLRPLRDRLLKAHVYPIFIVWETPWRADLAHELDTWTHHRSADGLEVEDAILVAAAESRARSMWDLIAHRSEAATLSKAGGARALAEFVAYKRNQNFFDLHIVAIGAGDLLASTFATYAPTPVTGAATVASPLTMRGYASTYGEMLADGCLQRLTVWHDPSSPSARGAQTIGSTRLVDLVSRVWALDPAAMRLAGRAARVSKRWDAQPGRMISLAEPQPLVHSSDLEAFTADGRFSPQLLSQLVTELTADRSSVGTVPPHVPTRDPLARAEARRQRNSRV